MRPFHGFGMIVEHYLHPVRMRKVQKALHIGKEFGVDIVSPAVGAVPPVGIDDHVVERDIVLFIIENELFRFLLGIGVILGIPAAQRGKAHEFAPARQFHIQAAQLFEVLSAQEQIDILRVFFHNVLPFPLGGIPALGHENARAVDESEHFGRLIEWWKFAAVFLPAIGIDPPAVLLKLYARKTLAVFGKIQFIFPEADDVLLLRIADMRIRVLHAVRDEEGVFIAIAAIPRAFDAHDILTQDLYTKIAENNLFHIAPFFEITQF